MFLPKYTPVKYIWYIWRHYGFTLFQFECLNSSNILHKIDFCLKDVAFFCSKSSNLKSSPVFDWFCWSMNSANFDVAMLFNWSMCLFQTIWSPISTWYVTGPNFAMTIPLVHLSVFLFTQVNVNTTCTHISYAQFIPYIPCVLNSYCNPPTMWLRG